MAVTFDFTELDPAQLNFKDAIDALKFQNRVKDFFHVVRTNPLAFDAENLGDFDRFVAYMKKEWALAEAVVPELRWDQGYSGEWKNNGAFDRIMRSTLHLRPRAASNAYLSRDATLIRDRVRDHMEYVETGGHGRDITAKDRTAAAINTERAIKILNQPLEIHLPEDARITDDEEEAVEEVTEPTGSAMTMQDKALDDLRSSQVAQGKILEDMQDAMAKLLSLMEQQQSGSNP